MKKNLSLSKKEIQDTFQKIALEKQKNQSLQEWIDKTNNFIEDKNEIWIVTDSSSSFINSKQETYG